MPRRSGSGALRIGVSRAVSAERGSAAVVNAASVPSMQFLRVIFAYLQPASAATLLVPGTHRQRTYLGANFNARAGEVRGSGSRAQGREKKASGAASGGRGRPTPSHAD